MKPLRLGILGTGLAARRLYWPELKKLKRQVQIVACANRTRKKAELFAKDCGIPRVVEDAERLFSLPQVEAVLISLPIEQQPRYVLQALRAGKHVLSEKPVAAGLGEGRRLLKAAKPYQKKGLLWLVGENFHFMPHVAKAEEWLAQGALGDLRLVEARQLTFMDESNPYFHTSWRTKPKFVGGFVVDAGVHVADILRRFLGLPTEIRSLTAQFSPALPPLDTALAALRFRSGVVGTWASCFSAHDSGPMLALRGSSADLEIFWDHLLLKPHIGPSRSYRAKHGSFYAQFLHFARAVRRLEPLSFSPEEALADLAFMQGIVQGKALRP